MKYKMYKNIFPKTNIKNAIRVLHGLNSELQLNSSFSIKLANKLKLIINAPVPCVGKLQITTANQHSQQHRHFWKPSAINCSHKDAAQPIFSEAGTTQSSPGLSPSSQQKLESELQQEMEVEVEAAEDEEMAGLRMRYQLYAEDKDEVIKHLNSCTNFVKLLQTAHVAAYSWQVPHLVQCLAQLAFIRDALPTQHKAPKIMDPKFHELLARLQPKLEQLNCAELCFTYLNLVRLNVDNGHELMREIYLRILDAMHDVDSAQVALSSLANFLLALKTSRDFHMPTTCCQLLPLIRAHIKNCQTAEDARLLAICLSNVLQLVDQELLDAFKAKLQQLLKANAFQSAGSKRCVLKVLQLLNLSRWSQSNTALMRELMLLLEPQLTDMDEAELKIALRAFQRQLEPAGMVKSLKQACENLQQKQPSPVLLAYTTMFTEPRNRELLIKQYRQMLADENCWKYPNASLHFFITLRSLKIAENDICNDFWSGVLKELKAKSVEQHMDLHFLRYCNWYMNFNNNLGGTYRHMGFEREICELAMHYIENTAAGLLPNKFAQLAAFVIAYGHTNSSLTKFPHTVITKIMNMAEQFSVYDCFCLSHGLKLAKGLRFQQNTQAHPLTAQMAILENVFTECTQRHLSTSQPLGPAEIDFIVRSLNYRKVPRRTQLYHDALNQYKQLTLEHLTSRIIREMSNNFHSSAFILPDTLELMFKYLALYHPFIIGGTAEKLLSCAYSLGYTPKSPDVFIYATHILTRDFDHMSPLTIVKACLALCFYKVLPEELIGKVFNVDFIRRIEEEIQLCYSKATYPERVLNLVMQLNRTVCLDFPEANVPWFQQSFIEAQLSKHPFRESSFNRDVKRFLKAVLRSETNFSCNHITPYGYSIDFVINFDENRQPIPTPIETTMLDRVTKVAILLLKLNSFCENDITAMRGAISMKMKHLEMMGYKVIHINESDWNAKYMNAPGTKAKYLRCLLKISS